MPDVDVADALRNPLGVRPQAIVGYDARQVVHMGDLVDRRHGLLAMVDSLRGRPQNQGPLLVSPPTATTGGTSGRNSCSLDQRYFLGR